MKFSDDEIRIGAQDGRRAILAVIDQHAAAAALRRQEPQDPDWLTVAAAAADEFQVPIAAVYTGMRRQDARARGAVVVFSCCFWHLSRDEIRARAFGMVRRSAGPAKFEAEARWVRDVSALAERACRDLAELYR